MALNFNGYRLTDTDASGYQANNIYDTAFTIDGGAPTYEITISDGSDADVLYGDGCRDRPTDATQQLISSSDPSIQTGGAIIYEAIVSFTGSDGNTYQAIVFDYDEDVDGRIENNNCSGTNANGNYEEGFFIAFVDGTYDADLDAYNISPSAAPPPGTTLTKTSENSNTGQVNVFVCFAQGTEIMTASLRPKAIEALRVGDEVLTASGESRRIKWIGARRFSARELEANEHLRPIRISAGALGPGPCPSHDLVVSPQHRVLLRSQIAERMLGTQEVLVAAKKLLPLPGVAIEAHSGPVTYYHFLFDAHDIVLANGAWAESLYPGPEALKNIGSEALEEIHEVFPELKVLQEPFPSARTIVAGRKCNTLIARHFKNGVPIVDATHKAVDPSLPR